MELYCLELMKELQGSLGPPCFQLSMVRLIACRLQPLLRAQLSRVHSSKTGSLRSLSGACPYYVSLRPLLPLAGEEIGRHRTGSAQPSPELRTPVTTRCVTQDGLSVY